MTSKLVELFHLSSLVYASRPVNWCFVHTAAYIQRCTFCWPYGKMFNYNPYIIRFANGWIIYFYFSRNHVEHNSQFKWLTFTFIFYSFSISLFLPVVIWYSHFNNLTNIIFLSPVTHLDRRITTCTVFLVAVCVLGKITWRSPTISRFFGIQCVSTPKLYNNQSYSSVLHSGRRIPHILHP